MKWETRLASLLKYSALYEMSCMPMSKYLINFWTITVLYFIIRLFHIIIVRILMKTELTLKHEVTEKQYENICMHLIYLFVHLLTLSWVQVSFQVVCVVTIGYVLKRPLTTNFAYAGRELQDWNLTPRWMMTFFCTLRY